MERDDQTIHDETTLNSAKLAEIKWELAIRLEGIKQARQNSLLLAGFVVLVVAAVLQIPSPLVHSNELKDYTGVVTSIVISLTNSMSDDKSHGKKVYLLASAWQLSIILMVFLCFICFIIALKSYAHPPMLGTLRESLTTDDNGDQMIDLAAFQRSCLESRFEDLVEIKKVSRNLVKLRNFGSIVAALTFASALVVMSLWSLFGMK